MTLIDVSATLQGASSIEAKPRLLIAAAAESEGVSTIDPKQTPKTPQAKPQGEQR